MVRKLVACFCATLLGLLASCGRAPLPAISEIPTADAGLSVAEAYAAIPHRRTGFDRNSADLPEDQKAYLELAFATVDQGVVLRVATMKAFLAGKKTDPSVIENFDKLIAFFEGVEPPDELKDYHEDVIEALESQKAFFAEWSKFGSPMNEARIRDNRNVQASSRALHSAYNRLMHLYPRESAQNKDAFFDHHCALDFI